MFTESDTLLIFVAESKLLNLHSMLSGPFVGGFNVKVVWAREGTVWSCEAGWRAA